MCNDPSSASLCLEFTTLALVQVAVKGNGATASVADGHLFSHCALAAHMCVPIEGVVLTTPVIVPYAGVDVAPTAHFVIGAEDGRSTAVLVTYQDVIWTVDNNSDAAHLGFAVVWHAFALCKTASHE